MQSEEAIENWLKENNITEVECLVPDITGNARPPERSRGKTTEPISIDPRKIERLVDPEVSVVHLLPPFLQIPIRVP